MGPKRRKTGNAAPTGVKRSDHETISALVERLVQCHEENSLDTSRDDFKVTIDANLPDNVKLGAHQAASILQVIDLCNLTQSFKTTGFEQLQISLHIQYTYMQLIMHLSINSRVQLRSYKQQSTLPPL